MRLEWNTVDAGVPPLPGLPPILRVTIHTAGVDGKTELTSQLVVRTPLVEQLFVRHAF